METLAPTFIYRHTKVRIVTEQHTEFIDVTDSLEELLAESRIVTGFLNVQSLHTTVAIVVNENEPLLLTDFECLLRKIAPDDVPYRHDDETIRTVNLLNKPACVGDAGNAQPSSGRLSRQTEVPVESPTHAGYSVSRRERPNGSSHCRALLLSSSACLNVVGGRLVLGRWQRVFLAELDGPQSRDISVLLIGEAAQ